MINQKVRRVRQSRPVLIGLVLLVGLALRVYRLDAQPLWWDESLSAYRATRDLAGVLSNTILIQNVVTVDTLPPLYFLLLNALARFSGVSEFALRALSLMANVATLPLLYVLGARWFSRRVGLLAAFLGALSPFYVWYAQEARPYALVLFETLLAVYALSRAVSPRRFGAPQRGGGADSGNEAAASLPLSAESRRWLAVYLVAATASLYTHYYAIFLLPFHAVLIAILLWPVRSRGVARWFLAPVIPLLGAIPLIPLVRTSMAGNLESGPVDVPLFIILRDLLNSFSVGVTADLNQALWMDALFLVVLLLGLILQRRSWRPVGLVVGFLAVPLLGLVVASLFRPLYQNSRYFITLSPAFYLGVALGVNTLAQRSRRLAVLALAVLLVAGCLSLGNLYYDPHFGKDDHRAWRDYLQEHVQSGDLLILDSPHTEELYRYYAGTLVPWISLPVLRADRQPSPDQDLATVQKALAEHSRVWFLEMNVPFDDPEARIETLLNEQGVIIEQVHFAGTSTEISLSLFAPSLPTAAAADIPHPLDLALGAHLILRGYRAPPAIESGGHGAISLFWQVDENVGEDLGISLRIVSRPENNAGDRWAQSDGVPIGNRAGTSTWPPNRTVVDVRDLQVDAGTRPGAYHLQVQGYHVATGTATGPAVTFGEIEVKRPSVPIDPKVLSVRRINQDAGGLRVLGCDWPDGLARPGDPVPVRVYMQVTAPPAADIPVELQLVQRALPLVGPEAKRAAERVTIPAAGLQVGDLFRQTVAIRVPADAGGEGELWLEFPQGQRVRLGNLRVQPILRNLTPPPISHPFAARLGDAVTLLGYDLSPEQVRPGSTLKLMLYWRAEKGTEISYKVFTHLIDMHDRVLGQQDSIPVMGNRPTTGWAPGEVIADPYSITLPEVLPAGKYLIEIGMYDEATGVRVPAFDANGAALGDRILIGGLEIR